MSFVTAARDINSLSGENEGGLGLSQGDLIVFQLAAENSKGTGLFSDDNIDGVYAQSIPQAPAAPTRGS